MSTAIQELVAILKAKIERGVRIDPIGSRERADNLNEIHVNSLALLALCVADYTTVQLDEHEWYHVEILTDGAAEWVTHSAHVDRECAERCMHDALRFHLAREARVVGCNVGTQTNGEAPPW